MTKKTPPTIFNLTIAKGGAPVHLASSRTESGEQEMLDQATTVGKALAVAEFKGTVQFEITKNGNSLWSSSVTFTQDKPTGFWNNVRH